MINSQHKFELQAKVVCYEECWEAYDGDEDFDYECNTEFVVSPNDILYALIEEDDRTELASYTICPKCKKTIRLTNLSLNDFELVEIDNA